MYFRQFSIYSKDLPNLQPSESDSYYFLPHLKNHEIFNVLGLLSLALAFVSNLNLYLDSEKTATAFNANGAIIDLHRCLIKEVFLV